MEKKLLNWLNNSISKHDNWITNQLKIISDQDIHITIKSVESYLQLYIKDKKENNNINNDIMNQHLYNQMAPLFDECKQIKTSNQQFIYRYSDSLIENFTKNETIYSNCLHILMNNKKLLIKKPSIRQQQANNGSNNDGGDTLFLNKIWRNKFIRHQILKFLNTFRNNSFKMQFQSIDSLDNYQFKDYLNHVSLVFEYTVLFSLNGELVNEYLEYKLSPSVRILEFSGNYDKYIKPGSLPSTINAIKFDYFDAIESSDRCNVKHIQIYDSVPFSYIDIFKRLPSNVSSLTLSLSPKDNNKITRDALPKSLTSLELDINRLVHSNRMDDISFPETISRLVINLEKINQIYKIHSMSNITELKLTYLHLIFKDKETIKKGMLPSRLKILDLGSYYNKIGKGVLPSTLTSLTLSENYNKTLKPGSLPESLECLSFDFKTPVFPPLEKTSVMGIKIYKEPVLTIGSIPHSLVKLTLSQNQLFLDILINGTFTPKHTSLTKLSILPIDKVLNYHYQNHQAYHDLNLKELIQELESCKFLPINLASIKMTIINSRHRDLLCPLLPLTKVIVKSNSYKQLSQSTTITTMNLSECNSIIEYSEDKLPINLTSLTTSNIYNLPIKRHCLPKTLTKLVLGEGYNFPIIKDSIPKSIQSLTLKKGFNQTLNIDKEFPNLETLIIGEKSLPIIENISSTSKLNSILVSILNREFLNQNLILLNKIKVVC